MWKLNLNCPSSKISCASVAVTNNVRVGDPSLSARHNSTIKCLLHSSLFAQFLAGRTHRQKSLRIKIKYLWEKWSHPGSTWGCPSSPYSLPVMNEDPKWSKCWCWSCFLFSQSDSWAWICSLLCPSSFSLASLFCHSLGLCSVLVPATHHVHSFTAPLSPFFTHTNSVCCQESTQSKAPPLSPPLLPESL